MSRMLERFRARIDEPTTLVGEERLAFDTRRAVPEVLVGGERVVRL